MAKCDCCGKDCELWSMTTLLPTLQSVGVKDICPSCADWATKVKCREISAASERTRVAIAERANKPAKRPVWWRRFA